VLSTLTENTSATAETFFWKTETPPMHQYLEQFWLASLTDTASSTWERSNPPMLFILTAKLFAISNKIIHMLIIHITMNVLEEWFSCYLQLNLEIGSHASNRNLSFQKQSVLHASSPWMQQICFIHAFLELTNSDSNVRTRILNEVQLTSKSRVIHHLICRKNQFLGHHWMNNRKVRSNRSTIKCID
jgi:hypothetical protein